MGLKKDNVEALIEERRRREVVCKCGRGGGGGGEEGEPGCMCACKLARQFDRKPLSVERLVTIGGLGGLVIESVACGSEHTLALTADGRVFGWGSNRYGQLVCSSSVFVCFLVSLVCG